MPRKRVPQHHLEGLAGALDLAPDHRGAALALRLRRRSLAGEREVVPRDEVALVDELVSEQKAMPVKRQPRWLGASPSSITRVRRGALRGRPPCCRARSAGARVAGAHRARRGRARD
jgi:hypothetical protein